jgi:hypothetical protein
MQVNLRKWIRCAIERIGNEIRSNGIRSNGIRKSVEGREKAKYLNRNQEPQELGSKPKFRYQKQKAN